MLQISEERAKFDEIELFYYELCATEVYTDCRAVTDKYLKYIMVELFEYYEQYTELATDDIDEMLFKLYKAFWAMAEPSLQKFYDEIQEILAVPPDCVPKELSAKEIFFASELDDLDIDLVHLQDKYMSETYFLHELKYRLEVVETVCKPLKERVNREEKIHRCSMDSFEPLEKLDLKWAEKAEKFLERFNKKKSFVQFFTSDMKANRVKEVCESIKKKKMDETLV